MKINGIEFELNSILVEKWKGKPYRLVIQRQRRIEGDLDIWEGEYTYRCILTNDYKSSARDIVEFYNLRGGKERIFDDMNNGFGWNRLPKSFMAQNTVFLLMTALIRNFYKAIMQRLKTHEFGLRATSRIKTFVFKFISVPAKWIKTSRRACIEHLFRQLCLCQPVQDRLWLKTMLFWLNQRITSSRFMG